MFITYVNKLCQKHSRVAFLLIGAVIIVPFVFIWGSPRDFLRPDRWSRSKVGEMYGHAIAREQFMWELQAADMSYFFRTGQLLSQQGKAQGEWYQEALRRMRALREAKNRGLQHVSDAEVAKNIRSQFQKDGVFDPALFAMFEQNVLARHQIDGAMFDTIIRENIIISRLDAQVTAGVFVSPEEARQMFNMLNEKYTVASADFTAADYQKDAATPPASPEAIRKFYADHVEPFRASLAGGKTPEDLLREHATQLRDLASMTDEQKSTEWQKFSNDLENYLMPYFVAEQKRVRVAAFPLEKFRAQAKISDERIKAYYEEKKAEYSQAEVHAQHILIRLPANAPAEQKEGKRKFMEGLRQMVLSGVDFGELAKKFSEDSSTKSEGGDLGYFGKGMMVEAVENAAFALDKGGLSPVVESPFGLHLIQVLDKRSGRSLAEAKAEIGKKLLEDETWQLATKAAQGFGDAVFNALDIKGNETRRPADLFSEMAAKAQVDVVDSAWFGASGKIEPFGAEPELLRQAIKLTPQRPLTETVKGQAGGFVACWLDTKPAYLPEVDKDPAVAQAVEKKMVHEKAVQLARDKAGVLFSQLQEKLAGGAAFAVAKGTVAFTDVPEFSRQQPPMQLLDARAIVEAVTGSKPGQLLAPVPATEGAVLVYVKSRTLPTEAEFQQARADIERQLKRQKEMMALREFQDKLAAESRTVLAEGWRARGE